MTMYVAVYVRSSDDVLTYLLGHVKKLNCPTTETKIVFSDNSCAARYLFKCSCDNVRRRTKSIRIHLSCVCVCVCVSVCLSVCLSVSVSLSLRLSFSRLIYFFDELVFLLLCKPTYVSIFRSFLRVFSILHIVTVAERL